MWTILILTALVEAVSGQDCVTCFTVFETGVLNTADPTVKCNLAKVYVNCVYGASTNCPPTTNAVTVLDEIYNGNTCSTRAGFTSTCTCQKTYLVSHATATDNAGRCAALKSELSCLATSFDAACDETTPRNTITTAMKALNTDAAFTPCAYSATCTDCVLVYAELDYSVQPTDCTNLKTLADCLFAKDAVNDVGCDDTKKFSAIMTDLNTRFSACSPTDTCTCQVDYMKAPGTAAEEQCTALATLMDCAWEKTTVPSCSGNTRKSVADDTDAKMTTACKNSLSAVCKCQLAFAKVDETDPTALCTAQKVQYSCLDGETGTGCTSSRTLRSVATADHSIPNGGCSTTAGCDCQIAFLQADVSGGQCPATETKINCLYAADTTGCVSETRVALMQSTVTVASGCGFTKSCDCQRDFGVSVSALCDRQYGLIVCLRGTDDAGCTGNPTRTQLATALETPLGSCSTTPTDTCQCEIDYAKATVSPVTTKCSAFGTLIQCLTGKSDFGCDGTRKPAEVAAQVETLMTAACSLTDTCLCQIAYAKVDFTDPPFVCPGKLDFMDCLSSSVQVACDGTIKRSALATALDISTCSPTDVCACQTVYARVDNTDDTAHCGAIKANLHCLEGKTDTGCKTASTVQVIAGQMEIQSGLATGCSLTSSCQCQVGFLKDARADDDAKCSALKTKMSCLVVAKDNGCDGTTPRNDLVTNIETTGIAGCTYSTTCTGCLIVYGKKDYSTPANADCTNLLVLADCLFGKNAITDRGCDDTKTIPTVISQFDARLTTCTPSEVCTCQLNYMKTPGADATGECTALSTLTDCLWEKTTINSCSGNGRHTLAAATEVKMTGSTTDCTTASLTDVCKCQLAFAKVDETDPAALCTGQKAQFSCLEDVTGAGCTSSRTLLSVATAGHSTMAVGCTRNAACDCQVAYLTTDISADDCPATENKIACLYATDTTGCGAETRQTLMQNTVTIAAGCGFTKSCDCQRDYGVSSTGTACSRKHAFISCLRTTDDTGCTGNPTSFSKTRTQLATDVEDDASCSASVTTTCQCEINYAKAVVSPTADKCTALGTLLQCLSEKKPFGCDGTKTPAVIAGEVETLITAECPPTDTCLCQIAYAKVDANNDPTVCLGKLIYMNCLSNAFQLGCDGAIKRSALATSLDITSCSPTDVCTCQSVYARVDNTDDTAHCAAIKVHLHCLEGKTNTGCVSASTVQVLAGRMETQSGSTAGCTLTNSCQCQVAFLKDARADNDAQCSALKTKMSCLLLTKDNGCDEITPRHSLVADIKTPGIAGCSYSTTCTQCLIAYGEKDYTTSPDADCTNLKVLADCLFGRNAVTDTGCDDTKTIATLITQYETRLTACSPALTDTCACELNYMKAPGSTETDQCTALSTMMDCLWEKTTVVSCSGNSRKSIADTTDGKMTGTAGCVASLSDVCKCQAAFAKVDETSATPFCTGKKTQYSCLEGKTGTGCTSSRTLKDVATAVHSTLLVSCTRSEACDCQIAYLQADISGGACPATENKIACLYDADTTGCTGEAANTIMQNTVTIGNTCSLTESCQCQQAFGLETGGTACDYKYNMVICLRGTTDAGCTGSTAGLTKTRTELGTAVENDIKTELSCTPVPTDTCQCEIDYAKDAVDPVGTKCNALGKLVMCLSGKKNAGCDGTKSAATLAGEAETTMGNDGCTITDTCACQIANAKVDATDTSAICPGLLTEMDCIYNKDSLSCDGTTKKSDAATALVATLGTEGCTTPATDTCKTCIYNYAKVDTSDSGLKCSGLGDFLHCLDGKTATSCHPTTPSTVSALATSAHTMLTAPATGCAALTDTCTCQYNFLISTDGACVALKKKLSCLINTKNVGCDESTPRYTLVANDKAKNAAIGGCTYSSTCSACMIAYGEKNYDTPSTADCTNLKVMADCLFDKNAITDLGCDDTKTITTLINQFSARIDACTPTDTCTCQLNYMKAPGSLATDQCTALSTMMDCAWEKTTIDSCSGNPRKSIADTTDAKMIATSGCVASLSDVCKCQVAFAKVAETDAPAFCTGKKVQYSCLEGITGTGCTGSRTLKDVATAAHSTLLSSCARSAACDCQIAYLRADISGGACPATENKIACMYDADTTGCTGEAANTIMQNTVTIGNTCGIRESCKCQQAYGLETGGTTCSYKYNMIICLRGTTDAGCTGSTAGLTKTRTELGTEVETDIKTRLSCSPAPSDTCQCEIDYAKDAVDPLGTKCNALGKLLMCLSGKTNTGCDGAKSAATLAGEAETTMRNDGCSITDTCECQITNAKIDATVTANICPGLLAEMDCIYDKDSVSCDGTTKKSAAAVDLVSALGTASCTATATDTCKTCIYNYAQVDSSSVSAKCSGLGDLIHCLDGKTATSCHETTPSTVSTLATKAHTALTSPTSGCAAITDTCTCQYNFIISTATPCTALKNKLSCLINTKNLGCDGSTPRYTLVANDKIKNGAIGGCTYSSACSACMIAYGEKNYDAPSTADCTNLKIMADCLFDENAITSLGCDDTKTITALINQFSVRIDACTPSDTCTCQLNYMKAPGSSTGDQCTALSTMMDCAWEKTTIDSCSGNARKSIADATDAKMIATSGCVASMSDVCKCQTAFAKVDETDAPAFCTGKKAQYSCLEGKTGTGCTGSRTLRDVATAAHSTLLSSCARSAACDCQIAYLQADISGGACPATENKIACMYDADTPGCTLEAADTIMQNTVTIGNTCGLSKSCDCQQAYGLETGGTVCSYKYNMIICLRGTTDAGCTGSTAGLTKTRTELGTDVETDIKTRLSCSPAPTDTCQCEIDYAKDVVDPLTSKCNALGKLVMCLSGKTNTGCDGAKSAATLAGEAETTMGDDGCTITDTCACQITNAKVDATVTAAICPGLLAEMDCIYDKAGLSCDGTTKKSAAAVDLVAALGTAGCTTPATDTCKTCIYNLAQVDYSVTADKCNGLGDFLQCLDGKTATSCHETTPSTVSALATKAYTALTDPASGCTALTDTCMCQYNFIISTATPCTALKNKLSCLINTKDMGCDGSTPRYTLVANDKTKNVAIGGCTHSTTCSACMIAYGEKNYDTPATADCTNLKVMADCLFAKNALTDLGCDDTKTIPTLINQFSARLDACTPSDTCTCQMNYMKAPGSSSSTTAQCTALSTLMDCLWEKTTIDSCSGDSRKSVADATDGKMTGTSGCVASLSDVCTCQVAFAKVDETNAAALCTGKKVQYSCLEGITGTGCTGSRTLRDVATAAHSTLLSSCVRTAACDCQIAYLRADISGGACPATENQIACLYATDTTGCTSETSLSLMQNTVAIGDTCGLKKSCQCQQAFRLETGGTACAYKYNMIKCLRGTTDAGCTGSTAGLTKTRTELGTQTETDIKTALSCSPAPTDTCQCEIDYAKDVVDPLTSKCNALGKLVMCLSGKTNTGCKGTKSAATLAAEAETTMSDDGCSITDTCACQITNAKVDATVTADICPGLLAEMDCIYDKDSVSCDGTTKKSAAAVDLVSALGTAGCTTPATDTCKTCIYNYAQVDSSVTGTKCDGLGDLLHCLDGKTATSCHETTPSTVSTLATKAYTVLTDPATSCGTVTDTCTCQYQFIINTGSACDVQKQRMECLVGSLGVACDGTTTRSAYATNTAEPGLNAVAGCSAGLTDTCKLCEIVYAKSPSDTSINRCSALRVYYNCLESKTAVSCFGGKTIKQLAEDAGGRVSQDSCTASLGSTCTCQANFLTASQSTATEICTAQKNKMSCFAVSFDNACDASVTRDEVAVANNPNLNSCTGLTPVCACERTYAVEPFTDPAVHCTNLKAAVDCVEGKSGGGCGESATIATFASAVLGKITELGTCTLGDTCSCQAEYLADDISTQTKLCTALEKKQSCLYDATQSACDGSTSKKDIIISVDQVTMTSSCGGDLSATAQSTCRCQINYGKETITPDTVKCTEMKKLIQCLMTTADAGCVGTATKTRAELTQSVLDFDTASGDCTLSAACLCQTGYTKADVSGANRCQKQKELGECLGSTTDTGCSGTASHTLAETAMNTAQAISSCVTDNTVCKCQLEFGKTDRTTPANKCTAYNGLLSCLLSASGTSCTGSKTKIEVVQEAESYVTNVANGCTLPLSDECTCATNFAKAVVSSPTLKCSAAQTLLGCMSGKTGKGCDGSQSSSTIVTAAETAVNEVTSGGGTCALRDSCLCEVAVAKIDSSSSLYCTALGEYFKCLNTASENGCDNSRTVDVLIIEARGKIAATANCELPDTCQCEDTYSRDFAANNSQQCKFVLNALSCLSTSSERSCDNTKTQAEVSQSFLTLQQSIASITCFLSTTCQCQTTFAAADKSTEAKKCSERGKFKNCVDAIENDQDLACDGITEKQLLRKGVVTVLIQGCRGCTLSKLSIMVTILLAILAFWTSH